MFSIGIGRNVDVGGIQTLLNYHAVGLFLPTTLPRRTVELVAVAAIGVHLHTVELVAAVGIACCPYPFTFFVAHPVGYKPVSRAALADLYSALFLL